MTRRIVIEVEPVSPTPGSVSQFATMFRASATTHFVGVIGPTVTALASEPTEAAVSALDRLRDLNRGHAPNGHMCGTPLACTLTGRCEQQFGPRGTACNE